MKAIDLCIERARNLQKTLVLPEGQDSRVVKAANMLMEQNICPKVVVLGSDAEISEACKQAGLNGRNFETLDYLKSDLMAKFVGEFMEMRKSKGITEEQAVKAMQSRIYFGAMMERNNMVDGLVAGSIASTADMLRAAFQCIGTAPGLKIASSCFLMDLVCRPAPAGDNMLLFADCGVNPNPNAEQLSDIAMATSRTYRALFGTQPKVAFLSFSTYGSAKHELLDKVVEAKSIFSERVKNENLDIICDGELQADAAIVPGVASSKAPNSPLCGQANILVFPDLNAGNICYKLVQRLAGADAYGPILQGVAKPLNDLSRGCVAEDIFGVAAITACQCAK